MKGVFNAAARVTFPAMLLLLSVTAHAASDSASRPFAAGNARLSVAFGGAAAFNRDYSVFGLGAAYFVADGIEVGLDAEQWFGNSPHIEQVSPQIKVVVSTEGKIKPYVGAFYRRTYIENYRDLDTVGGRAGVYVVAGRNMYFGAGLAQDVHLNCDRTVYASCLETFPELLVAVMF